MPSESKHNEDENENESSNESSNSEEKGGDELPEVDIVAEGKC
jgi:hypothetical protein